MKHFIRISTIRALRKILLLFLLFAGHISIAQIYNWAFNPSSISADRANSVKCDASGNTYVTGQFFGTIDIDPGVGVTNLVSAGDRDVYVAKYNVSGALVWAFKLGGTTADIGTAIAIDATGNVYVAGTFGSTVDFDPGGGTANMSANGFALNGFVAKYSSSGTFLTACNTGFGTSATAGSGVADIELDNTGNFYVTGTFYGTVDLDPGVSATPVAALGSIARYVSKFSPAGTFLFGFKHDFTGGSTAGLGIAVLSAGDFYVTGSFGGTTDFDPGAGVFNLSASGSDDGFVAKYTASGAFVWAIKIGGAGIDESQAIVADNSGNIYITGSFQSVVDFDPGTSTFNLTASNDDVFVAKYTSAGAFSWAFQLGGVQSNEVGKAVTMDSNNDLYVAGYFFSSNVDFDPGAGAALHSAANAIDIFVAKYTSAGNYSWSFSLSDNAGSQPTSLAVNSLALNLTGYFTGTSATIDCDPSSSTAILTQVGGEDGIIARYTHCISPSIVSSPSSNSICAFSNTSFSVNATGNGLTYQWQVNQGAGFSNVSNGGVYSGATTGTLSLNGPSTGMNSWQYRCVVNGLCSPSATSAVANLTVVSNPTTPGVISGSAAICAGASLSYSVAAVSGATSYLWSLPSGWTGSSNTNVISPTANANSGVITVSASNVCSTSAAANLNITTASIPLAPSAISGSTTVCANTTQQYSVAPVSGASTYSWSVIGGLTGTSSNNVINLSTNTAASGSLSVIASNSCGVSPSQSFVINVNPSPTVTVNSGSICAGQSFTIIPSGVNTYTVQGGNTVVSPNSNASYTVAGTSTAGCVSQSYATASVTVNLNPTISVNSGSICQGNSFTINPGGANVYLIQGGTNVVSPNANTSYTVVGTSTAGCVSQSFATSNVTVNLNPTISVNSGTICQGNSFTIVPGGASIYNIQGGNAIVSPNNSASYSVTGASSAGCVSTVAAISNVTVISLPVLSVNGGSICNGSSFTISPSGANTYSYSGGTNIVNPSTNTSYSVTGTSSLGCVTSTATVIQVTVFALPVITANGGTICLGQNFTITPTGASTYSITGNSFIVNPVTNTSYTVTGTSTAGCISSLAATPEITVHPLPSILVNQGAICSGESFTISPSGALTYTVTGGSMTVSPTTNTSYSVSGSNSFGCTNAVSAVASVTVYALPSLSITSSKSSICLGESVILNASGANTYTWNTSANGNALSVNPVSTTQYSVTGTDNNSCKASAAFTLNVDACTNITQLKNENATCQVYPNPNEGVFVIESTSDLHLRMINQLGQLVLEQKLSSGKTVVDISHLAQGIFMLELQRDDHITTKKVIKE